MEITLADAIRLITGLEEQVTILEGALSYKDKREAELLGQIKDLQDCLDLIAEDEIDREEVEYHG